MTNSELKSKLNASIDHLKSQLAAIRTGRATTSLVEEIPVEVYGSKMQIKELGTITTPDAQLIIIAPWDKSVLKEVDKAIRNSNLGLNPVTDSQVVKVPVPALTEERRKEFTKLVTERVEAAKLSIRNVRQEAMKAIDRDFDDKKITEDDKFSGKEDIEKIVKGFIEQAETLSDAKKI